MVVISMKLKGHKRFQRHLAMDIKRAASFSSAFRWARRDISKWNKANFATLGGASGKPWNALDTEYQSWKIAHYGPLPTMIRTGDLYRDLITLRGGPNSIGHKRAEFGTDVEYAHFHQTGTRFMPARKVMFVRKKFKRDLGKKMIEHILFGPAAFQGYKRIKSVVFTARHP